MQPLESLVRDARTLADPTAELARVMQICNACRYCEGFCAVFPAMTRRLVFPPADAHYLANLCHSCGACLHSCQYAPPHEFELNVPRATARVRAQTYADYAWPPALGALYKRNGLTLAVALGAGLALFIALAIALHGTLWQAVPGADFYRIIPHNLMVGLFAPIFVFALVALTIGVWRFWRADAPAPPAPPERIGLGPLAEAAHDVARLKYLDGGHGDGCNDEDDAFTLRRRRYHHATFYGFLLCFAATSVATVYHYAFGWVAPYAYLSLPKLLGIVGGVAMTAGTIGLWWLHRRRHPLHGEPAHAAMDLGFIALLLATAASGLVLTALRATPALPLLLALHLGAVMGLFLVLPYSKFAHGFYRTAALLRWAVEKRRPSGASAGAD